MSSDKIPDILKRRRRTVVKRLVLVGLASPTRRETIKMAHLVVLLYSAVSLLESSVSPGWLLL